MKATFVVDSSRRMTGEKLPLTASVNCFSSPVLSPSVQMLKIAPLRATSGSTGLLGSVAVDAR